MTIKMNPVTSRPMTPVNADLLISKIKEERYTFKMIENALHISSTSFYNKIQGKADFTGGEIATLKEMLNLTLSETNQIFFTSRGANCAPEGQ